MKCWTVFIIGAMCILAFSSNVLAMQLNRGQQAALRSAQRIDSLYHLHGYLPAILMVESSLCENLHSRVDPEGWGCGQLHTQTVFETIGAPVPARLLYRDRGLNIVLAALVLRKCFLKYGDGERGISCYNTGLYSGKVSHRYYHRVAMYRRALLQYRQQPELELAGPSRSPSLLELQLRNPVQSMLQSDYGTPQTSWFQDCRPYPPSLLDVQG